MDLTGPQRKQIAVSAAVDRLMMQPLPAGDASAQIRAYASGPIAAEVSAFSTDNRERMFFAMALAAELLRRMPR